jgi:CspA family cold shock protein
MATGKVKWFNNAKGYGFVRPDEGGEDLFVHYSYIQMDGFKSLKAGQPVTFDVQSASKGFHAVNIRPTDTESPSAAAPLEEDAPAGEQINANQAAE